MGSFCCEGGVYFEAHDSSDVHKQSIVVLLFETRRYSAVQIDSNGSQRVPSVFRVWDISPEKGGIVASNRFRSVTVVQARDERFNAHFKCV